jgi:transcription elongation factor Elf1
MNGDTEYEIWLDQLEERRKRKERENDAEREAEGERQ